MISRIALIDAFEDTQRKCREYPDLREATVKMQAQQSLQRTDTAVPASQLLQMEQ